MLATWRRRFAQASQASQVEVGVGVEVEVGVMMYCLSALAWGEGGCGCYCVVYNGDDDRVSVDNPRFLLCILNRPVGFSSPHALDPSMHQSFWPAPQIVDASHARNVK